MTRKRTPFRAFLFSFLLSFALFGAVCAGLLALGGEFPARAEKTSRPAEEQRFRPREEDDLTVLLMLAPDDLRPPERYALVRFAPTERAVRVVLLPGELEATVNITTGNLASLYDYGGVRTVCKGVENAFFIKVGHYVKCTEAAFAAWLDEAGGLTCEVERAVSYMDRDGETFRLGEGVQLLDGRRVCGYWNDPALEALAPEELGRLRCRFWENALPQIFSEKRLSEADGLFRAAANTMQTNLSNYDYTVRREALRFFLELREKTFSVAAVTGEFDTVRKERRFTPSKESRALVRRWFGEEA